MEYIAVDSFKKQLDLLQRIADSSDKDDVKERAMTAWRIFHDFMVTSETVSDRDIYRKWRHDYLIEDARNYTKNYIELEEEDGVNVDDVTEEQFESIDFEQMVSDFEEKTDYNDPTADIWESIVSNYRDYGYF